MNKIHNTESFYFEDKAGIKLFTEKWHPASEAKGVVQIAHGMREYTGYYREFCEALSKAGFYVYINDARGHGRTAGICSDTISSDLFCEENVGYAGDDGINSMVDDLEAITALIKSENVGLPVFLLGHSMGSVLAQIYAFTYGDRVNGIIYSGTTGPIEEKRLQDLLQTASAEADELGRKATSVKTAELFRGHFNDQFQPAKTGYEYMTRDESQISDAINSPYTHIEYKTGFYLDFVNALKEIRLPENIAKIPKSLPIFSVSGDKDPFGENGDGIKRLFAKYKKQQIKDATYRIYKDGRHEMLREINRQEVFEDIINWLTEHLN